MFCFSGNLACDIALKAVKTVLREENDKKEIDIKNYAKVEKVLLENQLNYIKITTHAGCTI